MLIRTALATTLLALSVVAAAQTPGEWRYTIATDLAAIPTDMRVNFPTITFSACRSADDFASGRAFALQTLASSAARCTSTDFVRTPITGSGKGDALSFIYVCDAGKTLAGSASGRIRTTDFKIVLQSRYIPPVNGVQQVKQTMSGVHVGSCKAQPDADLLKIK